MTRYRDIPMPIRCLIALIGSAVVLLLLWTNLSRYPGSSDHFFFPTVAQQILDHGGSLGDWVMASAPRYFPDLLIDLVSFSLVGSNLAGFVLAAILLVGLQWFAVSVLAARMNVGLANACLAGLLYSAICAIAGNHYTSISYISWHTGTFAIIVICLSLAISGNNKLWSSVVLVILVALVTASNMLAIPILIVGMGVVSLLRLVQKQGWVWSIAMPAVFTGIGCLVGLALYFYIVPYSENNPVEASNLVMGSIYFPQRVFRAGIASLVELATEPLFVAAFIASLLTVFKLRGNAASNAFILVLGFWLMTSVANQGLIELGAWDVNRYRIMPINGSAAVLAICAVLLAFRWQLAYLLPVFVLIPLSLLWSDHGNQDAMRIRYEERVVESDCLSKHLPDSDTGQVTGIGDQESTNTLVYLSHGKIRLIAVKGSSKSVIPMFLDVSLLEYTPVYVIANIEHDQSVYSQPRISFPLSEQNAIKQFGEPAARFVCGSRVMMHYPDGLVISTPSRGGEPVL